MDLEEDFDNSVSTKTRKRWVLILKNVYLEKQKHAKGNKQDEQILKYCKDIEGNVYKHSYKIINNNGIELYEYKTKTLFKFESLKKHLFYNLQSYIKDINLVFSILTLIPYDKIPENPAKLLEFTDKELSLYSGHAQWLKEYRERQETSKLIFNEKSKERGIFSCPKCKSFKIEMDEKQTRSADEPMTIYCKCEV